MAFGRRLRSRPPLPSRADGAVALVCLAAGLLWRMAAGVLLVTAAAVSILWVRLSVGPLPLPGVAELAASHANAELSDARLEIDEVVLALGDATVPAGLRFRGVRLFSASGEPVLAAPAATARFRLDALLRGEIRPVAVTLLSPDLHVERGADGGLSVDIGTPSRTAPVEAADSESAALVLALFDGLAGDAPPPPVLSDFTGFSIRDGRVRFVNRTTGLGWVAEDADLTLARDAGGVTLRLTALTAPDAGLGAPDMAGALPAALRLTADRRRGTFTTRAVADIAGVRTAPLAAMLGVEDWLGPVDARVGGRFSLAIGGRGDPLAPRLLTAELKAGEGRVGGLGPQAPLAFGGAELSLAYDIAAEHLTLRRIRVAGGGVDLGASGIAYLRRGPDGGVEALDFQLALEEARLALPGIMARPVSAQGGQISARVRADTGAVERLDGGIRVGDVALRLDGSAAPEAAGGWRVALGASAAALDRDAVLALWPLDAARNARRWIDENIREAELRDVSAALRFAGDARPDIAVDFRFHGLDATYVGEMHPISNATGTGHLSSNAFLLAMDTGEVRTPQGVLRLDGSSALIDDLWGDVTPGDLDVRATGPLGAVLDLIDQAPLSLISKLGLPLGETAGDARLAARVRFPLLQDLLLEQVNVAVDAGVEQVRIGLPTPAGETLITSPRLALSADTARMTVAGPVSARGLSGDVRWEERYGAGPGGRTLSATIGLTPERLAALGITDVPLTGGTLPVRLSLEQADGNPAEMVVDADLRTAALSVPALGWSKESGVPGRLSAEGRIGDRITVRRLAIESAGLSAEGALDAGLGGELGAVRIDRLRLGEVADLGATLTPDGQGGFAASVTGAFLDLSDRLDGPGAGGGGTGGIGSGPDLRVELSLDRLGLVEGRVLHAATGRFLRYDGKMEADLSGRLNGAVPVDLSARTQADGHIAARLSAADAGALLEAARLMRGARGGALVLEADLPDGEGPVTGLATIGRIAVPGLDDIGAAFESEGVPLAEDADRLVFDEVKVPFSYRGGVLSLETATAIGSALALKLDGDIDLGAETLALDGVASPAYGITGIFDGVPVLGTLFSGGEGEGVFAMNFGVSGALDNPDVRYSALSLFAPGILRRVFSGDYTPPSDRFLNNIHRERD